MSIWKEKYIGKKQWMHNCWETLSFVLAVSFSAWWRRSPTSLRRAHRAPTTAITCIYTEWDAMEQLLAIFFLSTIISAKSYWSFVPFLSSCACAFQLSLDIVWLHLCNLPSDYEIEQVFFTESCCSHSKRNIFVWQVFGCCSTYQCVCFLDWSSFTWWSSFTYSVDSWKHIEFYVAWEGTILNSYRQYAPG